MTGQVAQDLSTAKDGSPELMATIRVYGSILYTTKQWGPQAGETPILLEPEHIDGWIKQCAAAGVTTVLWRPNVGFTTYPSKFVPPAGSLPLAAQFQFGVSTLDRNWLEQDWQFLGEQCARFDTLEVAVASAHRHGLKIYLSFATFDAIGVCCDRLSLPKGDDRAWDPDMWLWSKDQKQRLAGVPCYAEPAVRDLKVSEIDEATDYELDGVLLSLTGHMDGACGEGPCSYGYNPTVVRQYRQRHSIDPLTEEVDPHKFYALHGEHFTEFVRQVSQVVRAKGQQLICGTRTDGIHGWGGSVASKALIGETMPRRDVRDGQSPLPIAAGFYLETEQWAAEKLVDGLMVAVPFDDGVGAAQQLRERVALPVYLWRKYTGHEGTVSAPGLAVYHDEIKAVCAGHLDGYALYIMQITDHPRFKPDWRDLYAS
jgi:uncharacterized lipoprotein YddW (UPF0748 family)